MSRGGEDNVLRGMKKGNTVELQEDNSSQYHIFLEDLEN